MPMQTHIEEISGDGLTDIALDTIKKKKQLIVFVNTKRSAEATAEKIGIKINKFLSASSNLDKPELNRISNELETAISSPTKQCRRLGKMAKNGVAFHHSGLHTKQRDVIEDSFKEGKIKVICATPTLAAGVDMPAYRVVIRDLKRYGGQWGMSDIAVLEYEQQCGRAGRPKYDKVGEAICIANSNEEKEAIWNHYVKGDPEEILSKLAVEPVLRTYILSLVATEYVTSVESLKKFMSMTFYAAQYDDLSRLNSILMKMIAKLQDWEFIKAGAQDDFVSASKVEDKNDTHLKATALGKRVAELYLDPYTANYLLDCMQRAASNGFDYFSLIQMICWTLEMRPMIRARQRDYEQIDEKIVEESGNLLCLEPSEFSEDYDDFTDSMKTAIVLEDWMNEVTEEQLLEKYNVSPGELNAKLDRGDWLLYASYELSKMQNFRDVERMLLRTRIRLKNGVKEELLPLLKLKNIGRVRARRMFFNKIKDLGDVKKIDISSLAQILGKKLAVDVKKQVGQEFDEKKVKVKPNKRKGQISLEDF